MPHLSHRGRQTAVYIRSIKMWNYNVIFSFIFALPLFAYAEIINSNTVEDHCRPISSCSECITRTECVWCVTKSKCTQASCGNDNIIYPQQISAIMSGPIFCPRIVEQTEVLTVKSGVKHSIVVKITQIHLYMAFTPWKCKIHVNGEEIAVSAILLGDKVYCGSVLFINKSNKPAIEGSVSVLWDYRKSFDGSLPFKVCRCDLDPSCEACKKINEDRY